MKTFMTDDFLLYNETAKKLYHDTAKHMPIIDYHNHLSQEEIMNDKNYHDMAEIWLAGDHYKWRAMRANGVDEAYITGDKDPYDKFLAWSKTIPKALGNPLYHWTHLELLRYFGIDELLDGGSAPAIWEETKQKLATPDFSARSLLKKDNVEFLATTDDPADDLVTHARLAEDDFPVRVAPSFRPDIAIGIESKNFSSWLEKLAKAANTSIQNYDDLLAALADRVDFFDQHDCRASDHGINVLFYEPASKEEVSAVFAKRLKGETLSDKEVEQYKTYTLISLGEMYADKGWAMQLHINPLRNNNTKMFRKLGVDSGFDSIADPLVASQLSGLLDAMELRDKLPKTILYSLNARDYDVLAAMAGNYQNAEIPGKVQFGTAWWFNDTIEGMENQLSTLANIGLISNFVGMLTDSRSFLSFSRHEYFRRVLCNFIGSWVEDGKAPNDEALLKQYVSDICYNNAKRYFNL